MIPRPPHVLLVITKGEIGGAQQHVLELCRALHGQVRFSAVIGGPAGSPLEHGLRELQVPTWPLPGLRNSLQPWRLLGSLRNLLALLRAHKPDVIHAHSAVAGVLARLAGQLLQVPVVYTVHGFGFKPQAPAGRRHSAYLAEALLAAWTTRMVCVSEHERGLAARLPMDPQRVDVVPNALADVPWRSQPGQDAPNLVMVARMAAPKRHDLLLRALPLLAAQGHLPAVHLLGDGPLRRAHAALAAQRPPGQVLLAGDVLDVPERLAKHAVMVLLSDHEGLPLSLIEGMRAGMAIVASRLPGVEELLRDGHEALLVENTPEAVAQALQRLLDDAALRTRLGAAARARYEARHRPEAMAARVLQIYEEAPLLPTARWPMTRPRPQGQALASAHAQTQQRHLLWALLGVPVLALGGLLGWWLQRQGWVTHDFGRTVLASLLPYFVAAQLLYRASHLPAAERVGLLLVTTATPFVLTPLGFALLQAPYSRGALLLSYALTTAWFWLGERWWFGAQRLKLLCSVHAAHSLAQQLQAMGPAALRAAQAHLQLLRWPAHWQAEPERCPEALALDGAIVTAVADDASTAPESQAMLRALKLRHIRLYSPQALVEALSGRVSPQRLDSALWQPDGNPAYDLLKRLLDVGAVLLSLPLTLPLSLAVALAVRLDSPGPAVFSQWRVGLHGRAFRIHKFRSMRHEPVDTPRFAGERDPRITRLGAFLRKSRLDELPQLWNVLRGQMSLIGPRPEQAAFVRQFAQDIPSYPYRHLVRPGITGWAQVQQGYAAGHDETAVKLSYDLYYVTHYSLAMDLLILAKTLRTVLSGRGAR